MSWILGALLMLAAATSVVGLSVATGRRRVKRAPTSRPPTDAAAAAAEPSALAKLDRRARVFLLAGRVYLSYKNAGRRERRLRRRLGLPPPPPSSSADDDPAADHPSVRGLWDAAHEKNAGRILSGIEGLSGFWIKVGQYLSNRADVMPIQYLQTLASLTDGVPAKPFCDVMQTLAEDLTEEQMGRFARIDPTPLSTASLAQVHRATLTDGREVVVKVQHRGVASLMLQDMANLRTILAFLARSDENLDFNPVVDEYTKEVTKELDFRTEAVNMAEVRTLLNTTGVRARVPESIPGLVTKRVLTMEFCPGFSIRDTDQLDENGVDRSVLLDRVVEAWAAQMHVAGTFNADPHSGNILVSTAEPDEDASVPVLLDFGLTKRLDPLMKIAFARLVHAAEESDVDALLRSFEEMGLVLNRHDPFEDMAAMRRSFADPVPQSQVREASKEKARDRKLREEAMKEDQGVEKGGKLRNPVDAWPAELVFFTRVTAMLKGLCSRLEVSHPYLQTMAGAARTALREAIPPEERATGPVHPSAYDLDTPLQVRITRIAEELIEDGHAVGLQLSVVSRGNAVANVAAGILGTADSRPVTPSSLFNAFSVSKAVLAAGVNLLLQQRDISVDDPIAMHWPEFASLESKGCITIRHALAHQAGLAEALPDDASLDLLTDWDKMKEFIASPDAVPAHSPGTDTKYHYISFAWILGGLVEAITEKPYEEYLLDNIIHPSGVTDEMFMGGVAEDISTERLTVLSAKTPKPVEESAKKQSSNTKGGESSKARLEKFRGREQMLSPSVFNMRKVRASKLPSANGHFSAMSLSTLFNTLVVGTKDRLPLLSASTVEAARTPQTPEDVVLSGGMLDDNSAPFGLGFQLHDIILPDGSVARTMGHAGLGGSIVLCIPEIGLSIAFTTNQLNAKSVAKERLLKAVFEEFRLVAPKSLIDL